MTPALSIIIPTHNRSATLPRTLGALAQQTAPPERYEVIVVADGCSDTTAQVVAAHHVPYHLTLIEQPGAGPAAARNAGAAAARGAIILFLDDDMEAQPGLVAAHLAAHTDQARRVVLGYYPVPEASDEDLFALSSRLWWAEQMAARAHSAYRYTFRDLCTGNVSLPRTLFEEAGRFDTHFQGCAGEDYELGVRLLKAGARFQFVRDAASIHHDQPSQERSFRRAAAEGRGHVLIARKHPELFAVLPLRWPASGALLGSLWRLVWACPQVAALIALLLRVPLNIALALKLRGVWQRIYGCLREYAYWTGVRDELRSLLAWREMAWSAPERPMHYQEREIDLADGLEQVEQLLCNSAIDSLNLRYGDVSLGRIEPQIGAEQLRPPHLREALLSRFSNPLLGALLLYSDKKGGNL